MDHLQQHNRFAYSVGEVAVLRELFVTLARGVRAARQYPAEHPIPRQFKQTFFDQVHRYFELATHLAVRVSVDSLETDGDVVYRSKIGGENIAHLLHRDGIRWIEIAPTISNRELELLFDAFVAGGDDNPDHDIVNCFWQSEFENIRYEVVDSFEATEVNDACGEVDLAEQAAPPPSADLDPLRRLYQPKSDDEARALVAEQQQRISDAFGSIEQMNSDDIRHLTAAVQQDRLKEIKAEVIDLLLQLCADVNHASELRLTLEALQTAYDRLIEEGRFAVVTRIVVKVRSLLESDLIDSAAARKRLQEFSDRSGDSVRIKMVTAALNKREDAPLEAVAEFLDLLGWEALQNLIWMLGELNFYPARRVACDVLVRKGREKIDILGGAVFDSRWYVVRNVVWVLGEMKTAAALSYLAKAAKHVDERVRAEVIKAAAKVGGEKAAEILLAFLNDSVERLRTMALNELARSSVPTAFLGLEKIIRAKEFADRPIGEIRQLLQAAVGCGAESAVELCKEIIGRTTVFNKARLLRLQEAATQALQFAVAPGVDEFLDRLANDNRPTLAAGARKALAQRRNNLEARRV